jgi:putative phosphonate transport system ATP-binding protein
MLRRQQNEYERYTPSARCKDLSKFYGSRIGCQNVSFELWPGEVLAIVGESGSGKTTLLNCLATRLAPSAGSGQYRMRDGQFRDLYRLSEAERRFLMRTDWGFVHQNPADGLRMTVSAGANVGERLMAIGDRHYGNIRATATTGWARVEIDETVSTTSRAPSRAACASVCRSPAISSPAPAGLHGRADRRPRRVGAGALLDLMRGLVSDLGLAAIVVTHDLAVARLLSHRMMVMKDGRIVETGLTDRVLDDPQAPYTQLLVSSILQV